MRGRRFAIAVAVLLAVLAGLGATIGYGVYYRSDLYCRRVEQRLADFFGMPAEIGAIRPYTLSSRELTELQVWLPDRQERVFHCRRAVWDESAAGRSGALVLIDQPTFLIGSEGWGREDYKRLMERTLAHNFRSVNVDEVRLEDARIIWSRRDLRLTAEGVEGSIRFDETGRGSGRLACRTLNGVTVSEPIQILATLDPSRSDAIEEVTLTVPPLPLPTLGLDQVLGAAVTKGSFAGRITLHQGSPGDWVRLNGSASDIRLDELTGRIPGGPIPAVLDLRIDEALVQDHELDRLVFQGEIRDLDVSKLLPLGLGEVGGDARLTVHDARIQGDSIERLVFSGEWLGAAADPFIKRLLGRGGVNGRLFVRLQNLEIRDNRLVQASAEVKVLPPRNGPATIERGLLVGLLSDKAGLKIPERLLPSTVEFTQMSARLLVDHGRMRILSVGGSSGPPLITARILGRELPLLAEIDESVDVSGLDEILEQRLRQWRASMHEHIRAKAAGRSEAAQGSRSR